MGHKIIRLIREASEREFKAFSLFLNSPYFNKQEKISRLLGIRRLKQEGLPELFAELFPGEPFNRQVLLNLLSKLTKLYKQFLAVDTLQKDKELSTLIAYKRAHQLEQQYIFQKPAVARTKQTELASSSTLTAQLANQIAVLDFSTNYYNEAGYPQLLQMLTTASINNEQIEVPKRAMILCAYLFLKRKAPETYVSPQLEQEIASFTLSNNQKENVLCQLYYNAFQLALYQDKKKFDQLYQQYLDQHTELHWEHINFIVTQLVNFCAFQVNQGVSEYQALAFEIYEHRLSKLPRISDLMIKNFVTLGCRQRRVEHIKQYLLNNIARINKNAFNFCYAIVSYYEKNYTDSLRRSQQVVFSTLEFEINTKHLVISNLFMLGEFESALYQLESFRIFLLRSKKINATRKRNHINFIKMFKLIINLKADKKAFTTTQYLQQIEKIKEKTTSSQLTSKGQLLSILKEQM